MQVNGKILTFDSKKSRRLGPGSARRNQNPEIINPKLLNPQPSTLNRWKQNPEIPNSKLLNPKPETLNRWKQNPEIAQRKAVVAVHSVTFYGCFGLMCSVAGNELIFDRFALLVIL